MAKRLIYKARAFVLHTLDYGESDRIVTFYTDEFGKLKGIAKGARRSRKRFANAIDLFSCSTIMFSRKNNQGLAFIEDCDVINYYPRIRGDLEKNIFASYFIELTDNFTVEGKKNPLLFQLLEDFIGLINSENNSEEIARFFELRLLKLSGYEPALEKCHICNTPLDQTESVFFSPPAGGIKCIKCNQNDVSSIPVSIGTIKMLLMGKEIEPGKIHRLVFSKQSLKESGVILGAFIRHILGKDLNSLQVLNKIRKMNI